MTIEEITASSSVIDFILWLFLNVLKLLFFDLEKYLIRDFTTKGITGLSHDQVALFKTFHGTTQSCAR
jgi:hypothetical protein